MTFPKENIIDRYITVFSLTGSLVLHLIVLVVAALILRFNNDYNHPGYAIITSINFNNSNNEIKNKNVTDKDKHNDVEKKLPEERTPVSNFSKIEEAGFDSTKLEYIYKEPTLNVRVKYPVGWTYVDQQRSNKLDGISFWSVSNSINPPPYVNIEVVEKYLFNPVKYKYKYKFKNFEGYYNEPNEIEGQISQQVYIRTNDDEDFIIKLIVSGKENFYKFQPVFFAMINSFHYGSSLFF